MPQAQVGAQDSSGQIMAIVALVLSILAILFGTILGTLLNILPIFGLIMGVVGIVLSVISKRRGFTGPLRMAAFVCSIISVVINAFVLLFFFVVMTMYTVAGS